MEPLDSSGGRLGRSFRTLVTSSGLSNLADGVFKVALPLLAIHYTRSPALVAGLELVRSLPWLVGSLQVGALVDRLDRRRTMVWANATRAAFVAVPAIAIGLNGGSLWLLYVAAAGTGVSEVFYDTAAQSILPSLVPHPWLDRANGRLYAVELGAQEFAGPPIAGLVVAVALALPSPRLPRSGSSPSARFSPSAGRSGRCATAHARRFVPTFARDCRSSSTGPCCGRWR